MDELREALRSGDADAAESALADLQMNVSRIGEHGARADAIVRSMLEHSRGTRGERALTGANPLVEEYVGLSFHGMRAQVPDFQAEIVRDYEDGAGQICVVPQEIGRVLLNLLGNAFYAVHQRRKQGEEGYAPAVHATTRRAGGRVEIRIEDNGPGIPEDVRDKIFEPSFTTKPTGEGTWLGLSLSHEIVTHATEVV